MVFQKVKVWSPSKLFIVVWSFHYFTIIDSGEFWPKRVKRIIGGEDLPSHDIFNTHFLVDIVHMDMCGSLQFSHTFPDCVNEHICMGSLVSSDFVLTNCHCMVLEHWYSGIYNKSLPPVATISPDDWPEWIDQHQLSSSLFQAFPVFLARSKPQHPLHSAMTLWMGNASRNSATQKRHGAKFFPHHLCAERQIFHNISYWQEVNQEMDIGLIRTCEPFKLNKDVKVAPFPAFGQMESVLNMVVKESHVCLIAGWGHALKSGSSQFPEESQQTWVPEILQHMFSPLHCGQYCSRRICSLCSTHHGPNLTHLSAGDSGTPYICDGMVVAIFFAALTDYTRNVTSGLGVPVPCFKQFIRRDHLAGLRSLTEGPFHYMNGKPIEGGVVVRHFSHQFQLHDQDGNAFSQMLSSSHKKLGYPMFMVLQIILIIWN